MLSAPRLDPATDRVFHLTVLSNFARGYDKYRRLYRKAGIPESTYPDAFYVLGEHDLAVGIDKASRLLDKLRLPGDELLAIEAHLPRGQLAPNQRNGLGRVWPSGDLPVARLRTVVDGRLGGQRSVEEAVARSLRLIGGALQPYAALRPRSLSYLPIARGCQAACPFCFSEASVSAEQDQGRIDWDAAEAWARYARRRGAERAVITGGGEPTLLRDAALLRLIGIGHRHLDKVVLITNGVSLAAAGQIAAGEAIRALDAAGLGVLAVSRHHVDEAANARLMKLETGTEALLAAHRDVADGLARLHPRLVCVLQRGGVEDAAGVEAYVAWAVRQGVAEICFKELYVSTSEESVYFSRAANDWSERHQVSLAVVCDWAEAQGLPVIARLPWGAPVYQGTRDGRTFRVAAYTEPSLFWERRNGLARSWNLMADGTCLASLEDRGSAIAPEAP
jgi:pyruvate-formate lyase-activating enzyme